MVRLRIDGRDLALAEGVVERIVHGLCGHPEAARLLAVDPHERAQAAVLGFERDVAQGRIAPQALQQSLRPCRDLGGVGSRERVLVLRTALPRRDLDVLNRRYENGCASYSRRNGAPEPLTD